MGRTISEDLRWRVVYLFYDNYEVQEIVELLKLSIATVRRIITCYQQWKCVINPLKGQTGRRKIFNGIHMKVISLFILFIFFIYFKIYMLSFYRFYVKL